MTILSVVQQAVTKLGMIVPDQVFASTSREMVEMASLVNEVAEQICDGFDWQELSETTSFVGDGVTTTFAAPGDYARMTKDAELFTSRQTATPLRHVLSVNDWLAMEVENFDPAFGSWILYGGFFRFRPLLADQERVSLPYIKNTRVRPAVGNNKALFNADDDTFVLSEKLLRLGIIWNWKAAKTQSYSKELDDYETALAEITGQNRGNRILTVGRRRTSIDAVYAFPYPLGQN